MITSVLSIVAMPAKQLNLVSVMKQIAAVAKKVGGTDSDVARTWGGVWCKLLIYKA